MARRRKGNHDERADQPGVSRGKKSKIGSLGIALKEALMSFKQDDSYQADEERALFPNAKKDSKTAPPQLRQHLRAQPPGQMKDSSFAQYPGKKSGIETDLVIGFDFGTSSSKIIIQDVDRRQAYAIPFPGVAPSGHDYLVPTRVFVDDDGQFSLTEGQHELTLLKSKLFAGAPHVGPRERPDLKPDIVTTAYFALILRAARKQFMTSFARGVAPGTISWGVNVGLPEEFRQQDKTRLLEICMLAGWECSVWHDSVTIDLAEYYLEEITRVLKKSGDLSYIEDEEKDLRPDQVVAVPEVVAQVQGYARSDMRRTGLHMMVDIGAATLDASTFTLFDQDNEDRYTIWEARVALLGALGLHISRIKGVSELVSRHLGQLAGKVDAVAPTARPEELVPDVSDEDVLGIDRGFADKVGGLLAELISSTHNNKDPKAKEWGDGLRLFLCGGGRSVPMYRERLDRLPGANGRKGPYSWLAPFRVLELPKPEHLEASRLGPNEYHRLAVAYGLSFNVDDIGRYEKGTDADIVKTEFDWQTSFVGSEQM